MVSAEALVRGSEKTSAFMLRAPEEKNYAMQIFDGDPAVLTKTTRIVYETH